MLKVSLQPYPGAHGARAALRTIAGLLWFAVAAQAQTTAPAPAPPQPAAAVTPAVPLFEPFTVTGTYAIGAPVGWRVRLPAGAQQPAGGYTWVARRNNAVEIARGTLGLSSGPGTIEVQVDQPAMVYVQVDAAHGGTKVAAVGAAVAPERLRPAVPRPADFDAFWDGKLAALAEVPIDAVLTPSPLSTAAIDLYEVSLASLGSRVRGWLARPKGDAKLPAIVHYQYAGVYALGPKTALDHAANGWLAFNVSSHDLPLDQSTGIPQEYGKIGSGDRETSYFLAMYLRDARALDYVTSRPDWDGRTLVVTGTSMGGQQSLVTAGLRQDVTAVVVNEPAGADIAGDLHGRKAGYPFWPADDPRAMATAPYFDVINFAPRIKARALVTLGFIDTITPPVGIWTAFNLIPGPKELIPMIESDHNNLTPEKQGDWDRRSAEVLEELRRTGTFEPR